MSAAVVSNERSRVGGAGRVTGSTGPGAPYAPGPVLADTQTRCFAALFADERHAAVQAAWDVYQRPVPGLSHRGLGPGAVLDATAH